MRSNPSVIENWREHVKHDNFEGRTTDQEALDYDEAVDLFRKGLKCAHAGDLGQACAMISTAFLLDDRSIRHIGAARFPLEISQEAKFYLMDMDTFRKIIGNDPSSFGSRVLMIWTAQVFGLEEHGQSMLTDALLQSKEIIEAITHNPHLENPKRGVLGGCMTRVKLHFLRSSLYMALGNFKFATKELTKALIVDPCNYDIRAKRAMLYAEMNSVKHQDIVFEEFTQVARKSHPDSRDLSTAYGWLALLTIRDPKHGTYQEAKSYLNKMEYSVHRQEELYPQKDHSLQICVLARNAMAQVNTKERKLLDSFDTSSIPRPAPNPTIKHSCLACGKHNGVDGIKLKQCACKRVYYCDRVCQVSDRKDHKLMCKTLVARMGKSNKAEPVKINPVIGSRVYDGEDGIEQKVEARTSIMEMQGQELAFVRVLDSIVSDYSESKKQFNSWWKEMNVGQRMKVLLNDISGGTMMRQRLSDEEILAKTSGGGGAFSHLYTMVEINVIDLTTPYKNDHGEITTDSDPIIALMEKFSCTDDSTTTRSIRECDVKLCLKYIEDDIFACPGGNDAALGLAKFYSFFRCHFTACMLRKLLDLFFTRERNMNPKQNMVRLMGCNHCRQDNDKEYCRKCQVCEITWWCCQGCMKASTHGRSCPIGRVSDSRVVLSERLLT